MIEKIKSPRKPQQKIRVTFPDGETICYRHAKDTVLGVLRRINSSDYCKIGLEIKGERIITQNVSEYNEKYKLAISDGWWYIKKGANTEDMVRHLIEIKRVLSLEIKIEHDVDLKVTNTAEKTTPSVRPKKKIRVFIDDKVFDDESFLVVYRDFVNHVGVYKIAKKNIQWKQESLVTTTNINNNRAKLGEYKWFLEPKNTKEAHDMIDLIAIYCSLTCKIEMY